MHTVNSKCHECGEDKTESLDDAAYIVYLKGEICLRDSAIEIRDNRLAEIRDEKKELEREISRLRQLNADKVNEKMKTYAEYRYQFKKDLIKSMVDGE